MQLFSISQPFTSNPKWLLSDSDAKGFCAVYDGAECRSFHGERKQQGRRWQKKGEKNKFGTQKERIDLEREVQDWVWDTEG